MNLHTNPIPIVETRVKLKRMTNTSHKTNVIIINGW